MHLKLRNSITSYLLISIIFIMNLSLINCAMPILKNYKKNQSHSDEKFEELQKFDFGSIHKELCDKLRHLLNVEEINEGNIDQILSFIERKKIIFEISDYEITVISKETKEYELKLHDKLFTMFIFNFNRESCTLNLTKEETKIFLLDDFFNDFIIPSEVELELDKENKYKIYYTIHHGYESIYKAGKGYQRNIYHIIEFMRGLYMISFESLWEISRNTLQETPTKDETSGSKFILVNIDLENLHIYSLANIDRWDCTRASLFIAGKIYYHNLNDKVKRNQIKLSYDFGEIFDYFDDKVEKIKTILRANFMDVETEWEFAKQHLMNFEKICDSIRGIYGLDFRFNFLPGKLSELQKNLKVLEDALDHRDLSPIVLQKILFIYDYVRRMLINHQYLTNEDINEMYEKSVKILNKFEGSFTKENSRVVSGGNNSKNTTPPKEFFNSINDLRDPNLTFKEYSDKFSSSIYEDLAIQDFYKIVGKIISLASELIKAPEEYKRIKRNIAILINRFGYITSFGNILSDEIQQEMKEMSKTYKILKDELRISIIQLNDTKLDDSERLKLFMKNKKKFILYYTPDKFNYFVVIPKKLLESELQYFEKAFSGKLKIYPEGFTFKNIEEVKKPQDP